MQDQSLNNPFGPGGIPPAVPGPLRDGVDAFVRRTYAVFMVSLLGICLSGFLSYAVLPKSSFIPLAVADMVIWVACGWFGLRRPIMVVLPAFCLITGLFLGQVANHYYPQTFMMASVLTLVTFAGLTAYVHVTRTNFNFLHGFLCISFFILLGGSLLGLFFHLPMLHLAIAAFGVLVFGAWILYDTSQIINRVDNLLTPEVAAFELIIDIVGLHSWLLDLLSQFGIDLRD